MNLSTIRAPRKAAEKRKRVGRGMGSGMGKTSTRGHKGQWSRSGARLLRGFRGRPPADVDALAETLVAVSNLAVHLGDAFTELDINPLMVLPAGQGVKAADALVVLNGGIR